MVGVWPGVAGSLQKDKIHDKIHDKMEGRQQIRFDDNDKNTITIAIVYPCTNNMHKGGTVDYYLHFHNHDVYGISKNLHQGCSVTPSFSARSGERLDL